MNTKEEIFAAWAPSASPWSAWAKPVTFTQLDEPGVVRDVLSRPMLGRENPLVGIPRASAFPQSAIVVDMPAQDTMQAAFQLVRAGYQPVPLFNTTWGSMSVVDAGAILVGLGPVAAAIASIGLRSDAPPAFLLDSTRQNSQFTRMAMPGEYDNRWLVFPQDFPSADFLRSHGIGQVVLYQDGNLEPAEDLAHVLRRWQEAGVSILSSANTSGDTPQAIRVRMPSGYRLWWHRLLVLLSLKRNSAGGFGMIIPEPNSGRGGFG